MAYSEQTWADGSGGGTPITAARLTHMEDGIAAAVLRAGDTMTGELVVPDLKVSGFGSGGFTNQGRYLGTRSAAGVPTTGTFLAGDWGFDSLGRQIACITAGTPGQWVFAAGTIITSAVTTAAQGPITATADIVGSTVTFAATAQPVTIELEVAGISNDNAAGGWQILIRDSANVIYNVWRMPLVKVVSSGETGTARQLVTGLTYGTSYTFKGSAGRPTANGNVNLAASTSPIYTSQLLVIAG